MTTATSISADFAETTSVPALTEYALHAESGEPEGSIFAEDAREAAQLWAMEALRDGEGRVLHVFEGAWPCGVFEVIRDRESATAREWRP